MLRIWPILSSATRLLVILTVFGYKNPRIRAQIIDLSMREEISVIFYKFYENRMKNKVTNRFLIKLTLYLNLKKFKVNTENTRSSINDRGSERVNSRSVYFHFRNKSENKKHVRYPVVSLIIKPVPHGPSIPVPEATGGISEMECSLSTESKVSEKHPWNADQSINQSKHLTQLELNDLTQDLNFIKEFAQLLGSHLHENNLLAPSTTYFWYQNKDEEFRKYLNYDLKIIPWYAVRIF